MPLAEMAAGYVLDGQEHGSGFAQLDRMTFLILAAVVLCVLLVWFATHIGADVVQALLAVAIMTLTWHMMHGRSGRSISDDFRSW